jgi:Resolvase, N terminal domain
MRAVHAGRSGICLADGFAALQILLDRVRARKIDIIVVYKVDRLTRSLADFAKLVELFDAHEGHLAETVCSACHKIEAYSQAATRQLPRRRGR